MSKKNSIALTVATETIARFKQLVVDLNDEMKKRNLVYLHTRAENVFEPIVSDLRKYTTAAEYLASFKNKFTSKISIDDVAFVIDQSPKELAAMMCTKAEFDEFKKNGYNRLRSAWLAEQKHNASSKKNDAETIKRKIAKLQAQLAELEG